MPTITFNGVTIFSDSAGGVGWKPSIGSPTYEIIEKQADLGQGRWIAKKGLSTAQHSLALQWVTNDPASIRTAINSFIDGNLYTLVIPVWGTFTRCRLESVSGWESFRLRQDGYYALEATLTFTQYPSGTGSCG